LLKALKGSGANALLAQAWVLWELPERGHGGCAGDYYRRRLFKYALTLAHEREFFMQKAIGWALPDYSRHDAQAVGEFTLQETSRLAPLSFREANKRFKAAE
jgi:hypothetical protein